jgi:hypothetical protein
VSGGAFDYNQHRIREIYQEIEKVLLEQGKKNEWGHHYPIYSKRVQNKFKKAIKALKIAEVYAQRVDWLISGDDGDESFLERLKEDLEALK